MYVKKLNLILYVLTLGLSLGSMTGCYRNSDQVWDDSKSAGRHVTRGLRTMGGKHGDSRAIQSRDQFMAVDDCCYANNDGCVVDFVPLTDQSNECEIAMADYISRQPRETPGDPGSAIPPISYFQDPSTNATWAAIFRNITFEYNSNLVKGQDNLETVRSVANYMKRNPNVYVFVEGHCDERGPEAYNLALGSRRGNAVRNQLLQEGVNADNIFTISYGKERPIFHDQNEESHSQNRRAEFKIYQR
ncbi:MAG TPA: OmpA family protein [Parachlamydiaceae bacterium]|nr:OmpA family protein [Parachlamydiaceae bacterium]